MELRRGIHSMTRDRQYPLMERYDNQMAHYLTNRWQDSLNQLGINLMNATVVLYLFTSDGYRVAMTTDNPNNPFIVGQERLITGTNIIDLIRSYGRMILIENAKEDTRLDEAEVLTMGFNNIIGLPIHSRQGQIIGELLAYRKEPAPIDNKEVGMVGMIVSSIEESIKAYELEKILKEMGIYDNLTRLITREKMMEIVQEEFDRSQRSEMPFSIVVIDIDNFRGINEQYGHDIGDQILQLFAKQILERIRHIDFACRWDGDAFAILLPQTEMIGANQLVSDLFFNLTHYNFPEVGRCYFSMGLADFSFHDKSISDMLLRLDKALYRVKAFGGNSHIARYH